MNINFAYNGCNKKIPYKVLNKNFAIEKVIVIVIAVRVFVVFLSATTQL